MRAQIGIIGGGFAGSLTACLLSQVGRSVVLLDPSQHPRFRIGESSTPTADLLLRELAAVYDIPALAPLTRYGSWRRDYPNLRCGCKRGFSYFRHQAGKPFCSGDAHEHELLVAASSRDEVADTHWLRADIDLFLFRLAERMAFAAWDGVRLQSIEQIGDRWQVNATREAELSQFEFEFLIDASGAGGALGKALSLQQSANGFMTDSRAVYSHFHDVASWSQWLHQDNTELAAEHPFDADLAAQHHVLDEGWMWMLRFDGNLTSVGLVLDNRRFPEAVEGDAARLFDEVVGRYPSLEGLLAEAQLAERPGGLLATPRLQRCWSQAAGSNWAMLPSAAGFIDPLHSTGIAHSIAGVARLVAILEKQWDSSQRQNALEAYGGGLLQELTHVDRLVAGCYTALPSFSRFVDFSMLYFVAAVAFEARCRDFAARGVGAFLGADDKLLRQLIDEALRRVADPSVADESFRDWMYESIAPLQNVGLGDRGARQMYQHTAAE